MKVKATGLLLAVAMMLGIAALPASAALEGAHAGVFSAVARVGKGPGTCNNDGTGSVSGGGIGLIPEVGAPKNAVFTISQGLVVDVKGGQGTANLCGYLTAPLQDTVPGVDPKALGIGASCATTKGWGGSGKATFPTPLKKAPRSIWITDLGWKITVGGTFLVTGDTGVGKGQETGLLVAVVQALNENVLLDCVSKFQGDKSNPDPFTVVAAYKIFPVGGNTLPEKDPKKP